MDYVKSLKTCVLSSGSRGNVTLIQSPTTNLLIDIGRSSAYTCSKLKEINVNPSDIQAILITHTHHDHIDGLKVFVKKYHPKIYLTKLMYEDINNLIAYEDCRFIQKPFQIGDLEIDYIKTSHDVSDSNGYIIKYRNSSLVYITDTGYIHQKNDLKLKNHNIYIMESNHDVKMLMEGKYPYSIKQRIQGDCGHLSNEDAAKNLSKYFGPNTKYIILAHLSRDNNTEEKAYNTLVNTLSSNHQNLENILIARQDERTELIEV